MGVSSAIFIIMAIFAVAGIAVNFAAIQHFRRVAPEEYVRAGAPSEWVTSSADSVYFAYLLRGRHKDINDASLVRKLSAARFLMLSFYISAACFLVTLLVSIPA